MRSVRYLVVGGAILLVLHLFMLGGGHAGTMVPDTAGSAATMAMAADGGQLLGAPEAAHDMLATCMAVLVGLLVGAVAGRAARRPGPHPPTRAARRSSGRRRHHRSPGASPQLSGLLKVLHVTVGQPW